MREIFKILVLVALGLLCGLLVYVVRGGGEWGMPQWVLRDTIWECKTETIRVQEPREVGEIIKGIQGYKLPKYFVGGGVGGVGRCSAPVVESVCEDISGDGDSAVVAVEIVQRHYSDSTYEAWVSGPIDPRLDSLRVYEREVVREVRVRDYKPPDRWGIGISAGWGMTPHGMGPYVGIGITYTIVTWKR